MPVGGSVDGRTQGSPVRAMLVIALLRRGVHTRSRYCQIRRRMGTSCGNQERATRPFQ